MLNTRAIRNGALLLSLGTGLSAVIKFISVPVLARLLTPEEFGIAGTALVLVSFATILSGGSGLGTALTYFKDQRQDYDHTVVWSAAALGLMVAVLCWVFSATLARAWGAAEAEQYIRAVALFFPFSMLAGIGNALLARDFNFRIITLIKVLASVVSAVTAILLAFSGFGAWSLIAQYCVFSGLKCTGFFVLSGYRPRYNITWERLRDIFPFAYRLTLAEALMWISGEGPFILVTWSLGVKDGGAYRIFKRLADLPREAIGANLAKAAYVGMAGNSPEAARSGFLWSTKTSAYLQGALFCWLAALSEPLTRLLLGPQYFDLWPLAVALAIGLAAQSYGAMAMPFLKAAGRTRAVLWLSLLRTALILTGAWSGLELTGTLIGCAWGIAVGMALSSLLFLAFLSKDEGLQRKDLTTTVLVPLLLSSLTGGTVFGLDQQFLATFSDVTRLLAATLIGGVLYGLLIRVFAPDDLTPLIAGLRNLSKRGRRADR